MLGCATVVGLEVEIRMRSVSRANCLPVRTLTSTPRMCFPPGESVLDPLQLQELQNRCRWELLDSRKDCVAAGFIWKLMWETALHCLRDPRKPDGVRGLLGKLHRSQTPLMVSSIASRGSYLWMRWLLKRL